MRGEDGAVSGEKDDRSELAVTGYLLPATCYPITGYRLSVIEPLCQTILLPLVSKSGADDEGVLQVDVVLRGIPVR